MFENISKKKLKEQLKFTKILMSFVPNIIEEAVRDRFLFEESPPQCNKM